MGRSAAIVQSNYIPWKGYFDLIGGVDEFILLDCVQYTRRDWRNRNKIKTPRGTEWLTIPVEVKGKSDQRIADTLIADSGWARRHWKSLVTNYSNAPHFREHRERFEALYLSEPLRRLSEVNERFIRAVCALLGIPTRLSWSMDYRVPEGKTERLIALCKHVGATEYLSGPSARDYLDEALMAREGIAVRYMDYAGYSEYPQLFPPFDPYVSVLDLLWNTGPDAPKYMKSLRGATR